MTVVLRIPGATVLSSPVEGVSIIATSDHEFYVRDEWIEEKS